jgi:hypothetical protein
MLFHINPFINSRWIANLIVKVYTIKLSEEKVIEYLYYFVKKIEKLSNWTILTFITYIFQTT